MGRALGTTEEQLRDLPRYRGSPAFTEVERLALDLAVEMAKTPVAVSPTTLIALRRHLDEAQLVELAAALAWENYRARFNRVFGVRAVGFSMGARCALPERPTREDAPRPDLAVGAAPPDAALADAP